MEKILPNIVPEDAEEENLAWTQTRSSMQPVAEIMNAGFVWPLMTRSDHGYGTTYGLSHIPFASSGINVLPTDVEERNFLAAHANE